MLHTVFENVAQGLGGPAEIPQNLPLPLNAQGLPGQLHGDGQGCGGLFHRLGQVHRLPPELGHPGIQPGHPQQCRHQPVQPLQLAAKLPPGLAAFFFRQPAAGQLGAQQIQGSEGGADLMRNVCQKAGEADLILGQQIRLIQ